MKHKYNGELYDEYECYGSNDCSECQEYQDKLSLAQETLEKLMRNLCGPFIINDDQLEDCLLELCNKLEVEYPHGWKPDLVKAKSFFHRTVVGF
jgi:hypothetical protein